MRSTSRLRIPIVALTAIALAAIAFCEPRVEPVPEPRGLKLVESPTPPALPPVSASSAGVPARGLDFGELAKFVAATSFEDFGNSTEGTVIARFEDMQNDRDPAQVWVHEKGSLRPGSVEDFDRAFGGKKQQWPPYTLVFAVAQGKEGRYEVVVKTWYDMGLFPDSRGGNEEIWQIARQGGRWVVLDKESTLHWD